MAVSCRELACPAQLMVGACLKPPRWHTSRYRLAKSSCMLLTTAPGKLSGGSSRHLDFCRQYNCRCYMIAWHLPGAQQHSKLASSASAHHLCVSMHCSAWMLHLNSCRKGTEAGEGCTPACSVPGFSGCKGVCSKAASLAARATCCSWSMFPPCWVWLGKAKQRKLIFLQLPWPRPTTSSQHSGSRSSGARHAAPVGQSTSANIGLCTPA